MIRPVLSIRLHKLSLLGGSEARKHILDALKKGDRCTKKGGTRGNGSRVQQRKGEREMII